METLLVGRRDVLRTAVVIGAGSLVGAVAIETVGCSASWIQTALNDLPVLVQIAESIMGIVGVAQGNGGLDPSVGNEITTIASAAKASLQTLQSLISSYQSSPSASQPGIINQIDAALTAVQSNLQQLFQVTRISNTGLQSAISTGVSLALATVASIELLIPSVTPSPVPPTPASQARITKSHQVKGGSKALQVLKSDQIRSMYNAVVVWNGFATNQI